MRQNSSPITARRGAIWRTTHTDRNYTAHSTQQQQQSAFDWRPQNTDIRLAEPRVMQKSPPHSWLVHLLFEGEEVFLGVDAGLRAELPELLPSFVLNL